MKKLRLLLVLILSIVAITSCSERVERKVARDWAIQFAYDCYVSENTSTDLIISIRNEDYTYVVDGTMTNHVFLGTDNGRRYAGVIYIIDVIKPDPHEKTTYLLAIMWLREQSYFDWASQRAFIDIPFEEDKIIDIDIEQWEL